jgi:hypothetical protein
MVQNIPKDNYINGSVGRALNGTFWPPCAQRMRTLQAIDPVRSSLLSRHNSERSNGQRDIGRGRE